jgi:hypothetical protein
LEQNKFQDVLSFDPVAVSICSVKRKRQSFKQTEPFQPLRQPFKARVRGQGFLVKNLLHRCWQLFRALLFGVPLLKAPVNFSSKTFGLTLRAVAGGFILA